MTTRYTGLLKEKPVRKIAVVLCMTMLAALPASAGVLSTAGWAAWHAVRDQQRWQPRGEAYTRAATGQPNHEALSQGGCADALAHGVAPQFVNQAYARQTRILCYGAFEVDYSEVTRTPLWSAEQLNAARVAAARRMRRHDSFHPEMALPVYARAELSDYVHSGYDRGHLSPNGDMPDSTAQYASFTLTNIAPQDPGLNRGPWAELEGSVRDLAAQGNVVYVVTGVLFEGAQIGFLKGRVAVPTAFYKIVYVPGERMAGAFIADNRQGATVGEETMAQFEQEHGVEFGFGQVTTLTLP